MMVANATRLPSGEALRVQSFRLLFVVVAIALAANAQNPLVSAPIAPLTSQQRTAMTGKSWNPGCPVSLDDLVSIRVTYYGFDNQTRQGTIVLHKRFASEAAQIFTELYAAHFPINKIDPWENYGPDVYAEQDITVGFYCERADDAPTEWSSHSYGVAIDLNPRENPFRDAKKGWWPATSAVFAPRDKGQGKISSSSDAFRIFTRHGWGWGGFFAGEPDLMHFTKLTFGPPANPADRPYVINGLTYHPGTAFESSQPK
jgi:hypothetical protein